MKVVSPAPRALQALSLLLGGLLFGDLLLRFGGAPTAQASVGNAPLQLGLTAEQTEILKHLSLVYRDNGMGGTKKTLRISDIDVQIVNGLGATNGLPNNPESVDPQLIVTNGLGNLIIGYNERTGNTNPERSGSHNLIVGLDHSYSSIGGLVASYSNTISAPFASVSGGHSNSASGFCASITGGDFNVASGLYASVTAGFNNLASGQKSAVSGGLNGWAYGVGASVSGGFVNRADGYSASVTGGSANLAQGQFSTVSGGGGNWANSLYSSVSGGRNRMALFAYNWVAGSLTESN